MTAFTPAEVRRTFTQIRRDGTRSMGQTISATALVVERQAKVNASSGAHKKGTPTPAHKGSGPARITGNLVRNVTHTRVQRIGMTFTSRIGPAHTAKYGQFVEELGYPWLLPAFHFGVRTAAMTIALREFRGARRG